MVILVNLTGQRSSNPLLSFENSSEIVDGLVAVIIKGNIKKRAQIIIS